MYVRRHPMSYFIATVYMTVDIYKCTSRKSATTAAQDINRGLNAVLHNKEVWS